MALLELDTMDPINFHYIDFIFLCSAEESNTYTELEHHEGE